MRRLFSALLVCLMLCGCAPKPQEKQYNATFLDLFDTVTTVVGKAESEEAFREKAQAVHDALLRYHQLFDIYNEYEGLNNLKTVNDQAGIAPVAVDPEILQLLSDCKDYYALTGGRVNVAMGSVLNLWHEAREAGTQDPLHAALPDETALTQAAAHMDPEDIQLDREAGTVFLTDPDLRLDVGAVAKGWAVQRISSQVSPDLLISVGGNVCATGPKDAQGTPWVVGVQNPDGGEQYLHTLYLENGSVVTSGDYQRTYVVDGTAYHHIIDPDTLYPAAYWRSVSILCSDSGLADALSTALFLLPQDQGQAILDKAGAEAMWVDAQGRCFYSPGFQAFIRT